MQNQILLVGDFDTLVYFLCYRLDSSDVDSANQVIDDYVELIFRNTNCTHYLGFLGEHKTFRHEIYPEYKSNRKDNPDWLTKWRPFVRQRLITHYGFIQTGIIEAEDACSIVINHYKNQTNIVYAHTDKDGNSIGEINHYDYSKHQFWYTDTFGSLELMQKSKSKKLKGTGLMWLYAQYCLGDKIDFIPSLKKGCGDVYVYNLLKDCKTEWQLHCKVYREFLTYSTKEAFILNRILVKMLTEESYGFVIPSLIERRKEEINLEDIL